MRWSVSVVYYVLTTIAVANWLAARGQSLPIAGLQVEVIVRGERSVLSVSLFSQGQYALHDVSLSNALKSWKMRR